MRTVREVAELAGVTVRALHHYDEIGLLPPVWVDPDTGYRWYAPEQLHRLHRILVLRDGLIEEEGTFNELLSRGGFFSYLYNLQAGGKQAAGS